MGNFLTLNVRGLRKTKKCSVFKKQKCDIVFIQEAFSQDRDIDRWKCELWGGEIFAVCDTVHSKGLMILLSPQCQAKVLDVIKGENKRYICVKTEIENVKYNLWNFY